MNCALRQFNHHHVDAMNQARHFATQCGNKGFSCLQTFVPVHECMNSNRTISCAVKGAPVTGFYCRIELICHRQFSCPDDTWQIKHLRGISGWYRSYPGIIGHVCQQVQPAFPQSLFGQFSRDKIKLYQ